MVEHGVTTPTGHVPPPAEPTAGVPPESARAWWFSADRWMQIVIGIAVLALVVWAFKGLVFAGLILLCPLMMIAMMFGMGHGMHRMHGGHQEHDDEHTQAPAVRDGGGGDHALDILRDRYARGDLSQEQYEAMRGVLQPTTAAEQNGET